MTKSEPASWRIIPFASNAPAFNMALDEAILQQVGKGVSPPTIRFYGWQPNTVSIGYFQSLQKEVRTSVCEKNNVSIVRRITGGGAVYHDTSREITYSLICPESYYPKDILQSYQAICQPILDGLHALGISAEFKPINDIIIAGKKVSGNAQTRRFGAILQHGTILYDVDPAAMFSVLNVGEEKIRDKFISAVEERVTAVSRHTNASKEACLAAMMASFSNGKTITEGQPSPDERALANQLTTEKYASTQWLNERP